MILSSWWRRTMVVGAVAVTFILGALWGWPWQGEEPYLDDPRFPPIYIACQEDEALVPATGECLALDNFIDLGGNATCSCTSSTATEQTNIETGGMR